MENRRILNRIIFINIANTDYASIDIAGNTCFVGTNNMGKTTLQRAILFFYSANTRGLGISSSQKSFEDYYFQYPNAYIIYEVATEEGLFHIMVYRNNKIFYRFVDHAFDSGLYISSQEALLPKEVLGKFNESKINYSDQIETFERYRNILYGADPDKRYKKFSLMKGNSNYHNIPLAITSIFLSSESVIKAEFVKECIANSISTKHTNIELKTVERQLRQFTERYQDIEAFFKKENAQRGEMIKDNFAHVKNLKTKQRSLAEELGANIKYAELQRQELAERTQEKKSEIERASEAFKEKEILFQEQNRTLNQEIGGLHSKLKEADKKQKEYDKKNIEDLLRKALEKPRLQSELEARNTEYATLTAGFKDIEQQYKTLFDALLNERKEFENVLSAQGLGADKKFQDDRNALRDKHREEAASVREKYDVETLSLKEVLRKNELSAKDADFRVKEVKSKKYFEKEVLQLMKNIDALSTRKIERSAAIQLKNNSIESLKKESHHIRENYRLAAEQVVTKNKEEIQAFEKKVSDIEGKLSVHQSALFGFLQENYPDWYQTIGKVCNESLLFNKNLNPKKLKGGLDSLYGIGLDLSNVQVFSRSLEDYEKEKSESLEKISALNQSFLDFRETQAREEQSKLSGIGKKLGQLKNEIDHLVYEGEQDEEKEKQLSLDIKEWQSKEAVEREKELVEVYSRQEQLKKETAKVSGSLAALKASQESELSALAEVFKNRLAVAQKEFQEHTEALQQTKEEKLQELELRKEKLGKDKSKALKKNGIDDAAIRQTKEAVELLVKTLKAIEEQATLVSDYNKDKRELFDKVPEFVKEKDGLDRKFSEYENEFKDIRHKHEQEKSRLEKTLSGLTADLKKYAEGLEHFEKHFKNEALFDRIRTMIEQAPAAQSEAGITALCSQLSANDGEYHRQLDKFKSNINEFTGRFRPDNHLNFRINPSAQEPDYESFAAYLQDFYSENKIQTSIAEVAKSHGMLIDAIASKVKALTDHKGRINRMIGKMETDFGKASFESSQLIEYIKLKSEDSENKVLRKLQKISEFREQNPFLYGESNLFNSGNKAKSEIDRKSVELLNDLQKTIAEENYEEIKVQDLFELKFRIKEGKNDTGWIEKIDKVGSTGTDMLVKAVIYITLLNVFIKESTDRSAQNFMVHCIIDEVGQISASYLKELIRFAEDRNICLINGLPNESKLETHYNYTYKFRKDQRGNVKVVPLLTMSIEP